MAARGFVPPTAKIHITNQSIGMEGSGATLEDRREAGRRGGIASGLAKGKLLGPAGTEAGSTQALILHRIAQMPPAEQAAAKAQRTAAAKLLEGTHEDVLANCSPKEHRPQFKITGDKEFAAHVSTLKTAAFPAQASYALSFPTSEQVRLADRCADKKVRVKLVCAFDVTGRPVVDKAELSMTCKTGTFAWTYAARWAAFAKWILWASATGVRAEKP
ncbi:hypothetical protein Q5752_005598 [Cryptotrichosporon argae]